MASDKKLRCDWAPLEDPLYLRYHDEEWGVPVHEDNRLFEMLVLEGAQAGLSWGTILRKRENFQKAFDHFDPEKVSKYDSRRVKTLMADKGIIRNELKIRSAIQNATAIRTVQKEFETFNAYVWDFVGGKPMLNGRKRMSDIPAKTPESVTLSKDLLKRGFRFVGPTICYAYMQAVGMVNDHLTYCFRYRELGG